jgi:hypothetical protein
MLILPDLGQSHGGVGLCFVYKKSSAAIYGVLMVEKPAQGVIFADFYIALDDIEVLYRNAIFTRYSVV